MRRGLLGFFVREGKPLSRERQSIVQGAAILTASTVIVKVIGALFKIPLANILGGVGMSYFVSAYDVFTPLYSMAVTGLSIATSRRISESCTGRRENAGSVLATAKGLFLCIGLFCTMALLLLSGVLTNAIGNPGAQLALCLIAPSLIFSCVAAAYRGYFQGQSNMLPTAKSQVLEAAIKLLTGVGAAFFLYRFLGGLYEDGNAPEWLQTLSGQQAKLLIMQISAAGAVLGVTFSTLAGMLFISGTYRRRRMEEKKENYSPKEAKKLLSIAVPIAATSAVANLTTLIDLSSVMNCLKKAVESAPGALLMQYHGALPPEVTQEVMPEFLYGCYSGLAVSIFNLVPALTAGIGVSAIPIIAAHYRKNDRVGLNRSLSSILLTTAIIAFPAGLGIFALPQQILLLLYPNKVLEVAIIAPVLRIMGISTILVAFSTIMNNVLQAVGKEKTPLFALLFGGLIKLVTNYSLVSRPEVNIHGVAYGTLFCYAFLFLVNALTLVRCGFGIKAFSALCKPLLAGGACCLAAKVSYGYFSISLENTFALLLSIVIAVIVYFAGLFSMKCIKSAEISYTFYERKKRK